MKRCCSIDLRSPKLQKLAEIQQHESPVFIAACSSSDGCHGSGQATWYVPVYANANGKYVVTLNDLGMLKQIFQFLNVLTANGTLITDRNLGLQ